MKHLNTIFLLFHFTISISSDNVTPTKIDTCDSSKGKIKMGGDSTAALIGPAPIINELSPLTVNPHLEVIDKKYANCRDIDIRELSVSDFQNLFKSNKLTSVELIKCYLGRLDRMNPVMRAVIEVNPDVLKEAEAMDLERSNGKSRGSMHGIPVLLKESIGTVDKTETTCGAEALIGIRPKKEAPVMTSLKKAGAVIMGKSSLPEFYG